MVNYAARITGTMRDTILILPDPAQLICAIRMVRGIAVGAGRAHLPYIGNLLEQPK
jgi:hypothetical protein